MFKVSDSHLSEILSEAHPDYQGELYLRAKGVTKHGGKPKRGFDAGLLRNIVNYSFLADMEPANVVHDVQQDGERVSISLRCGYILSAGEADANYQGYTEEMLGNFLNSASDFEFSDDRFDWLLLLKELKTLNDYVWSEFHCDLLRLIVRSLTSYSAQKKLDRLLGGLDMHDRETVRDFLCLSANYGISVEAVLS